MMGHVWEQRLTSGLKQAVKTWLGRGHSSEHTPARVQTLYWQGGVLSVWHFLVKLKTEWSTGHLYLNKPCLVSKSLEFPFCLLLFPFRDIFEHFNYFLLILRLYILYIFVWNSAWELECVRPELIPLCIPNVKPLRWLTRAHNNSLLYLLIFKIKETQTCVDENVTPYPSPNLKLEVHAKNKNYTYIYIYISSRIKDDASIICDSRLWFGDQTTFPYHNWPRIHHVTCK